MKSIKELSKKINRKAVILIGPPLSGEKEFISKYVETIINSNPVIMILTDRPPEDFEINFKNGILKFIDCYSKNSMTNLKDTKNIRRVSGPLALNEISISLNEIQKEFIGRYKSYSVIFNSLSTLLMYSNPLAISRFIQILIARIKRSRGNIIFTLEKGMHDEKTVVTLEHLMDVIIEINKKSKKIIIKARGIEGYENWNEIKL